LLDINQPSSVSSQNTNQLTQAVEGTALGYMETGYQQELTYRHSDGSFSAFGSKDDSGSTWFVTLHLNIPLLGITGFLVLVHRPVF
jgi:hypothetical protein